MPSPGGTPQGGLSCPFGAIHLRVAPEGGRETAPSGACGEQPPKAALGERRNSGCNLKVNTNVQTSSEVEVQEEVFRFPEIVKLPPAFLFSQRIGSEEPIL